MYTKVGELHYQPPEMLIKQEYDERIDYWQLGVLIFKTITGYYPFDNEFTGDLINDIINN